MKILAPMCHMIQILFLTVISYTPDKQTKNKDHEQPHKRAHELGTHHHMEARLQVPEKLGYFNGETLVDVGCGSGRFLK